MYHSYFVKTHIEITHHKNDKVLLKLKYLKPGNNSAASIMGMSITYLVLVRVQTSNKRELATKVYNVCDNECRTDFTACHERKNKRRRK